MGIDYDELYFSPIIKNQAIANVFLEIKKTYLFDDLAFRVAKLNKLLLELIIELVEHHIERKKNYDKNKNFEAVKQAVVYIRKNYSQKLTLDMIAKYVMIDKYALCREFKTFTGQTVFENINKYRCLNAAEYLKSGYSVADAATTCGFKNLSFFTKTFKKYIGILPSKYKCTYNYSQP